MSNEFLYITDGLQIAAERKTVDISVTHSYCTYFSVTLHLSLSINAAVYHVNSRRFYGYVFRPLGYLQVHKMYTFNKMVFVSFYG